MSRAGDSRRAPTSTRQSGDGRSIDAVRPAPAQGIAERRKHDGSSAEQLQSETRIAGDRDGEEKSTTICSLTFSVVSRGLVRPTVMVMPVRRPVGMHMILAAVIVDADGDMILSQAVRDVRIIGKGEGGRRREDAKGVQQGN